MGEVQELVRGVHIPLNATAHYNSIITYAAPQRHWSSGGYIEQVYSKGNTSFAVLRLFLTTRMLHCVIKMTNTSFFLVCNINNI